MSKDALRAAMPITAAIVDEYRAWMADGGKVIYAEENGRAIDRREPEPNVYELEPDRFRLAVSQPVKGRK